MKPGVMVEIGPVGPRPLVVSTGAKVGPQIPYRQVAPLIAALVADVQAWIEGPDTDQVVLGSVRAQLRSLAVRRARFRRDAEPLGNPGVDAIPEFYRVRWEWLLAEYARRVLDEPGAVKRAVALAGDWTGTAEELAEAAIG